MNRNPEWRSPPWRDFLNTWRNGNGITVQELAWRLDVRWAVAHRMCHDDVPMDDALAQQLERVTSIGAKFWTLADEIHHKSLEGPI